MGAKRRVKRPGDENRRGRRDEDWPRVEGFRSRLRTRPNPCFSSFDAGVRVDRSSVQITVSTSPATMATAESTQVSLVACIMPSDAPEAAAQPVRGSARNASPQRLRRR